MSGMPTIIDASHHTPSQNRTISEYLRIRFIESSRNVIEVFCRQRVTNRCGGSC
jgi:hypothetical protein